jgi:hypothetical protein
MAAAISSAAAATAIYFLEFGLIFLDIFVFAITFIFYPYKKCISTTAVCSYDIS